MSQSIFVIKIKKIIFIELIFQFVFRVISTLIIKIFNVFDEKLNLNYI
jgi:hypothetical protein